MPKLVALALVIALLTPGCFTTIGAVAGSGHAHSFNDDLERRRARGEQIPATADEDPTQAAALGGMIGIALDTLLVGLMVHRLDQDIQKAQTTDPGWD